MGPDIIAELEEMANVDSDLLADLEPHFDPITFQEVTTNPKIEEYRLTIEELRQWGLRATFIRQQILLKAQLHLHNDEIPLQEKRDSQGRIKYPLSKASDHPDGLYEAQLKLQS